jgi:predicted NAD-dependent protein-ADP-ribosyltransferase YbiA (DUF1768 family)
VSQIPLCRTCQGNAQCNADAQKKIGITQLQLAYKHHGNANACYANGNPSPKRQTLRGKNPSPQGREQGPASQCNQDIGNGSEGDSHHESCEHDAPANTRQPKIAASPAPAAPPKKRLIPIPKDSATFFNARAKDIKAFQFNSDGNLAVPEMRGEPAKVIELPFYRDATIDEKREKEEKIKDELVAIEKEYDETVTLLREAMEVWRTTGAATEVVKYQRDLSRLDAQRTMIRSPLRWVKKFDNPVTRDILLANVYEQRKMGYPVSAMILRSMTFSESVRPGEKPVAPSASAANQAEGVSASEANAYIVFFDPADPEYGILSPETMVDFVFNSTKYTSLLQAFEVERVTAIGRKDLRPILLKQVNPKQIRTMASRIIGKLENAREIWIQILKSATSQDPRFKMLLQSTGDDIIVYADPSDTVLGVGLPAVDIGITDRTQWKGDNM